MTETAARRLTLTVFISLFVYALACYYSPISWSPDGERVAFIKYSEQDGDDVSELWILNIETGLSEKIDVSKAGLSSAAWSPDGTKIAYIRGDIGALSEKKHEKGTGLKAAVVIYDTATKESGELCRTFVPREDGEDLLELTSRFEPSWSPDGWKITFDCFEKEDAPKVMIADMSGNTRVFLDRAAFPQWSPDGRWIACFANFPSPPPGEGSKVAVMRIDGTDCRTVDVILPGEDEAVGKWTRIAWSPNSDQVCFASLLKEGSNEHSICVADLDGKTRALASGDKDHILSDPAWTKDGKSITFVRRGKDEELRAEVAAIVSCAVLTQKQKVLTRFETKDVHEVTNPAWSPDGNWLAYWWDGEIIKLRRKDGAEEKEFAVGP